MVKKREWYGDKPNRRCSDCGQPCDWDERLRLGYYAKGGAEYPDGTPMYDPARRYGQTPEGLAEQAKLNAHHKRSHQGGKVEMVEAGAWALEIRRYSTGLAHAREALKAGRPFYGILQTTAPNGKVLSTIIEGGRTPEEIRERAAI